MPIESTVSRLMDPVAALVKGIAFTAERFRDDRDSLREIADAMELPVTVCSQDFSYRWVSKAYARLIGRTVEQVIGKPFAGVIGNEACEALRTYWDRVLRGEMVECEERVLYCASGWRWIHAVYAPTFGPNGAADGWVAMVLDVEEQRRTHKALSAETEALAKLNECSSRVWRCRNLQEGLNEMLDAVIQLLGADKGNVQILNRGVLTIEAQRGFDEGFLDFFREVSSEEDSACARALRTCHEITIEDIETDGAYAPLRPVARAAGYRAVISTPLISGDGGAQGILSAHFSKVHRPSDQELYRLDLYARLASDFIHRCKSESALRESEEALRQSDRLKDEFLALLGHELRNPVGAISNSVALLEQVEHSNSNAFRAVQIARRQVTHLARLLDDLLDVSRVVAGKIGLTTRPIDLGATVRHAIEGLLNHNSKPQHEIRVSTEAVWINGDPVRIEQVLGNLLGNALKFTPESGEISISVDARRGCAVLTVADSGIGISKQFMPKIFQPFAQAEPEFSSCPGSLGLGLALTKRLVELHDGDIRVESDGPGRGSTFTASFPLIDKPLQHGMAQHQRESCKHLRVLLIEDNDDNRESIRKLLEMAGHKVTGAADGPEGIEAALEFSPQAALIDLALPTCDGHQVARQLRTNLGHAVRLVALSGFGRDADKAAAYEAGFDAFLVKPVEPSALIEALHSAD